MNGKRKWVCNYYDIDHGNGVFWYNSYTRKNFEFLYSCDCPIVVIEGLEVLIQSLLHYDDARHRFNEQLEQWLHWETQESEHQLILIGTEISKGVVPMEAANRRWRDLTGWCYQDVTRRAERVDLIWYGLPQQLK
ncbi:bifunctional adenosylcobinamide kinase/adenosylcobinamide-phosphate guanylyltransferase [Desertibacillus haloalkaliphilus]|uniref:bifunctional adenosylcobinamide kinase/adenosylcobinamide-phosphate guanylyltransferase n=1 Tax=Desertibacillus haloalkaliphilus TaxID=1328930 RepID=UPI001C276B4C|nr:bifunctional adenosylcobinamide kinase/adenosylcobinamide-phosphate guanylyltransferase [Desertibacillus haloalkaliphilus]MBU8907189.1 bifunctional adenosylcobinamide kinase/adenosylcobinamide-phosphate guanylyltransferase [Desertibacillus haloalkaliphilus]